MDYGLGRRPAPDARDARYPMRLVLPSFRLAPGTRHYPPGPVLDQGNTGTCVGHAWRGWLNGAPLMTKTGPSAMALYREFVKDDWWPENDFESTAPDSQLQFGTSVRAGVEWLQKQGQIANYVWATTVDEVRAFLLSGQGTVVFGTDWYADMFNPDKFGVVRLSGGIVGGHAYKATGWSDTQNAVRCQNSWGRGWGQQGRFWLKRADLQTLLDAAGECCAAVEQKVTPILL